MNISEHHQSHRHVLLALLCLAVSAWTAAGCSRAHYRRQADAEAFALTREKIVSPHSDLGGHISIAIDPRSRMYDAYNPDRPPIPEDDPDAHQFMHTVDGKKGWPFWHDNGERPEVENPVWKEYLEFDESGKIVLTGNDAVRVGLINSREYQAELEQLYLSALDVSFERFLFDTQFFGGYQTNYTKTSTSSQLQTGPFTTQTGQQSLGTGFGGLLSPPLFGGPAASNGLVAQKTFTTGSTLVVGFANSLLFDFGGTGVVVTMVWVSPRVKSAEPWARGRIPTSMEMLRISSSARPSMRRLVSITCARMTRFFIASYAAFASPSSSGQRSSPYFSASLARASSLIASMVS